MDWYEPDLLLEAWPGIVRRHPNAKLLFFENPNPQSTPQKGYARAREQARTIDRDGRTILFAPWRPYTARADLYAACDLVVSISSIGAGAIGVTVLFLLYPKLPMARIVGSDIAHAVPLTLVAGIGHWAMGSIDWQLMGVLLTGSLPGIIVGSYCATRVPETALRLLLAATLVLVAAKLGSDEWQKAMPVVAASTNNH